MASKTVIIATSAAVVLLAGGTATAIVLSGNDQPDPAHSMLTAKGYFVMRKDFQVGTGPGSCYADTWQQHQEIKANATVTIRDETGTIVGAGLWRRV